MKSSHAAKKKVTPVCAILNGFFLNLSPQIMSILKLHTDNFIHSSAATQ